MAVVETVKVIAKNKQGYMTINKKDFTNKHTIFKEEIPGVKKGKSPKVKKEGAKNE